MRKIWQFYVLILPCNKGSILHDNSVHVNYNLFQGGVKIDLSSAYHKDVVPNASTDTPFPQTWKHEGQCLEMVIP